MTSDIPKAYVHLIHHAIRCGHFVSVWDGEEWQVSKSKEPDACIRAVESVEEASIRVWSEDGQKVGWAVTAVGLAADETIYDHSDNAFMNGWWTEYEKLLQGE